MDKAGVKSDYAPAGVSVRNGPVTDAMEVDEPATNGAKRKSRTSTSSKAVNYNLGGSEDTDEDVVPLVC